MTNTWRAMGVALTLVVAAGAGQLATRHPAAADEPQAISDRNLSLSKTSVFEIPAPPPELTNTSDPGDQPTEPTDFPEQPPLVPHGVADLLPITLDENQCIDCHMVDEKIEGEPTPIPASHYVDLRNAPGEAQVGVVGARYNCVACHAVPGQNPPLVENRFVPGL